MCGLRRRVLDKLKVGQNGSWHRLCHIPCTRPAQARIGPSAIKRWADARQVTGVAHASTQEAEQDRSAAERKRR